MTTLTVAVPEELTEEVGSWSDGTEYNLVVTQTAPGKFDLVSGEAAPDEEEEPEANDEEYEPEESYGVKKKMPPHLMILVGKK